MNENLIFEGNTVYELDPLCLSQKEQREGRVERKPDVISRKIKRSCVNDNYSEGKIKVLILAFALLCQECSFVGERRNKKQIK